MSDDNIDRMAAETKAWQLGESLQAVNVWLDEDRRHLVLVFSEHLTVRLQAEEADALLQELARQSEITPTVHRWMEEIREERADTTGAARLWHIQERQRREAVAAGTLGKSVYATEPAKAVRIIPDDGGDPK